MIEHQVFNSYDNYNAYIYVGKNWATHFHKNYELIYIIAGKITVYLNGIPNELESGELILVSPFTIHSFDVDKNSRVWVGVFTENYIQSFAKKNRHLQYSKFCCDNMIDKFLNEYLFYTGTPTHHMGKACLYMVCDECLKKATVIDTKSAIDFKGRVIEYVSENLASELTLLSAAQALGYEYHYFSALFHRSFGLNFKEFVNIFRYEYASEMLLEKSKDISYIAGECGFQSIRNFNRVFKKLSGKTPSDYRKLL